MRNGQLKPGYNLQIGVSGEYIAALGLFPNPTDTTTLIPFLERMKSGINRSFRDIVADMEYASEENYTYLENNGQNAYIKPSDHEVKKRGSTGTILSTRTTYRMTKRTIASPARTGSI